MAGKKKNLKLIRRAARAGARAQQFSSNTEDRIKKAVKAIANDSYNFNKLVDDIFGQWSDWMKVISATGDDDEVGTAYFVTGSPGGGVPAPIPTEEVLVTLSDMVDGGSIDTTDLTGPVTFSKANYQIIDPATDVAPVTGSEMDTLKVRVTALPPQAGTYHGVITLGSTKVLARVVYVLK